MAADKERDATPEEMRALGHPLRWRILRLTLERPLTNKEIALRLDRDPGTVLHHVRELVKTGFLVADDVRSGKRGALERPYRASGKSWHVRLQHSSNTTIAIIDAVREEVAEAGTDSTLGLLRLGVRLKADDIAALRAALEALGAEYLEKEVPDGDPVGILAVLHRRRI